MNRTITILLISFMTYTVQAQYGLLDNTFDGDGKLIYNHGGGFDNAADVLTDESGKLVVAGTLTEGSQKIMIARFHPDGALDNTFGTGGINLVQVGNGNSYGVKAAFQSSGKIIVAGNTQTGQINQFTCLRFNTDGSLDATFANGGIFVSVLPPGNTGLRGLVVQPDDQIVMGGFNGDDLAEDFILIRLQKDGDTDNTFGQNGYVYQDISGGYDALYELALQSGGKIVAVGHSSDPTRIIVATLARFNADGTLDTSFGNGGFTISTPGPLASFFDDIAVLDDGSLIAAGVTDHDGQYDFLVAKYTENGSVETGFGQNGYFIKDYDNAWNYCSSVIIQPDQKIILTGYHFDSPESYFALLRITADGETDSTFGDEGYTMTNFIGAADYSVGSTLQPDGKVVLAGSAGTYSDYQLAMARYTTGINPGLNDERIFPVSIEAFPNPAKDAISVIFDLKKSTELTVSIRDFEGRLLAMPLSNEFLEGGKHELFLDIKALSSGPYLLSIESRSGRNSRIFVKH